MNREYELHSELFRATCCNLLAHGLLFTRAHIDKIADCRLFAHAYQSDSERIDDSAPNAANPWQITG